MIVEATRLPNGDVVSEKPTGRLRWRISHHEQNVWSPPRAVTVLQQEFDRTRFVGEEEIDEGSFWRDVPTVTEGPSA